MVLLFEVVAATHFAVALLEQALVALAVVGRTAVDLGLDGVVGQPEYWHQRCLLCCSLVF